MLVSILFACGSGGGESGEAFDAADEFAGNCAGCHNADGTGGQDIGGVESADLTVRAPEMTDDEILTVLDGGLNGVMPAQFDGDATKQDAMLSYLRDTFGGG